MEPQVKAQDMELLLVPLVMEPLAMADLVLVLRLVDLELRQDNMEDTMFHRVVLLQRVGMVFHLVGLQDMEDTSSLLVSPMEEEHQVKRQDKCQVRGPVYPLLYCCCRIFYFFF